MLHLVIFCSSYLLFFLAKTLMPTQRQLARAGGSLSAIRTQSPLIDCSNTGLRRRYGTTAGYSEF